MNRNYINEFHRRNRKRGLRESEDIFAEVTFETEWYYGTLTDEMKEQIADEVCWRLDSSEETYSPDGEWESNITDVELKGYTLYCTARVRCHSERLAGALETAAYYEFEGDGFDDGFGDLVGDCADSYGWEEEEE